MECAGKMHVSHVGLGVLDHDAGNEAADTAEAVDAAGDGSHGGAGRGRGADGGLNATHLGDEGGADCGGRVDHWSETWRLPLLSAFHPPEVRPVETSARDADVRQGFPRQHVIPACSDVTRPTPMQTSRGVA